MVGLLCHTRTHKHTHISVTYLLPNLKQFSIVLAKIEATYNIKNVGHVYVPQVKDNLPSGSSRMSLNPSCLITKSGFLSSIIAYIVLRKSIRSSFGYRYYKMCGSGSSVGMATDYGLDGPGSNPGGDEIFRPSRPTLGPTQPPVQCVPGLSRG